MADDELAQIRAARLAQLKQQGGGGGGVASDGQSSEQDQKR
jgi:DNA-binding TFAR19-related protein (PDSD5 family)